MKKSVTRLLILLTAVFALVAIAGCELTGTNNLNDADRRGKPEASSVSTPPTVYEGAEGDSLLLAEENFIESYYPEEGVVFTAYSEPFDFTPYDPVVLTPYEPEVYFYYDNGLEISVAENDPLATHKKTGFYTTGFNLIGYNTIGERIIGWESAVFDLWAGQDNNAGTVTISNDNEFFYITVDTNTTADLEEVHINVYEALEELPDKRPAPGQAPYYAKEIYADSVTVQIPVTELADLEDYYFVIHAALVEDAVGSGDGESNAGETAYAAGNDPNYDGRGAWFYTVGYTLNAVIEYITENVFEDVYQDVIEELATEDDDDYVLPSGSETAFGVMVSWNPTGGQTVNTQYSNDFLDNGFKRWGWTNGLFGGGLNYGATLTMYAGAGQSDITKGTNVGLALVNYNTFYEEVIVHILANSNAQFEQIHVYIGEEKFPLKNGKATVSPGQYPYIHDNPSEFTPGSFIVPPTDTFRIPWPNGVPFYAIVHAAVTLNN